MSAPADSSRQFTLASFLRIVALLCIVFALVRLPFADLDPAFEAMAFLFLATTMGALFGFMVSGDSQDAVVGGFVAGMLAFLMLVVLPALAQ